MKQADLRTQRTSVVGVCQNGIGSFRPTNNGMFGRFKIIEFKEIKE